MASGSEAQRKTLEKISVTISETNQARSLSALIAEIEREGKFTFAYSKRDIRNAKVSVKGGEWNMNDLLREISIQARLSIRRVNETIALMPVKVDTQLLNVSEKLMVQTIVTGQITDESGEGLTGAAVVEKGTTNGTITNTDGRYSLNVSSEAILVISFVGYISEEVAINGRSVVDMSLMPDITSLNEVVVVAYGTQSKKDLTSSISSLKAKDLGDIPVSSADALLQERLLGCR